MSARSSLLLTCGLVLILCHLSSCQNWGTFKRKHLQCDGNLNCNTEMKKGLFNCKKLNTYICASEIKLKDLCKSAKEKENVLSSSEFQLTNCQRSRKGCRYSKKSFKAKICVTCENKEPVHLKNVGRC
ncbi:angiogenin [Gastrophryne carolinensis]